MKKLQNSLIIGLIAVGTYAVAGSVGTLKTFTANTTAKASEVNANFSAVKTAVNGNAADIATKQKKVSGTCAAGSSIRMINANGTVVCETDSDTDTTYTAAGGLAMDGTDIKRADGHVSVSAQALHRQYDYADTVVCNLLHRTNRGTAYFVSSSTHNQCRAVTGVQLPDGATIKSLSCTMYRSSSAATTQSPSVYLYRADLSANTTPLVMASLSFGAGDTGTNNKTDTIVDYAKVNNGDYGYFLNVGFGNKTSLDSYKISFYGCTIEYSY